MLRGGEGGGIEKNEAAKIFFLFVSRLRFSVGGILFVCLPPVSTLPVGIFLGGLNY